MNGNMLSGFSKRKGISPLIAAVLLIAFTMAVASLFAQWAPQLINSAQDDASEQREEVQRCSGAIVEIMSVSDDNSSVTFRQTSGSSPVGNVTVTYYHENYVNQSNEELSSSSREAIQNNGGTADSNLDRVTVTPQCGGAAGDEATWQELQE